MKNNWIEKNAKLLSHSILVKGEHSTKTDIKTINIKNQNRTTALERSVINYWVGRALTGSMRSQPRPQFLEGFKTFG